MKNRNVLVGIKTQAKYITTVHEDNHVNLAQITCVSCPNFHVNSSTGDDKLVVELPEKNGIITPTGQPDPKKMFICAKNENCGSEITWLAHATSIKDVEKYLQNKRVILLGENKSISSIDPQEKFNGAAGHQALVFPVAKKITAKELAEYNYHELFTTFINKHNEKILNNALPRAKHDHEFNTAQAKINIISKKSAHNEILFISAPKSEDKNILNIND